MTGKILIVTGEMDTTADVMVRCLNARGVAFERLHPKDFPVHQRLSLSFSQECEPQGQISGRGISFDWDEIKSVWYRRPDPFEFPDNLTNEEKEFAAYETTAVFAGMWRSFDALWVNHPDRIRVAESKALQLKVARELGMPVPSTLFTNDAERLRKFYDEMDGRVVYKSMTQGVLGRSRQQSIFTTRLSADHLENLHMLKTAPGLFQQEITKYCDLRITLIGEKVFAVEILAPEDQSGNVDWRYHAGPQLKHAVHRLPADIERFCLALARNFSLNYAAIDMVLTPKGQYVFLEVNPNGQFGWLESMAELPLTETLADLLATPLC
jgi:glutathione synthase/RimK-type ligase-like ATP-grasp enzyme